MKTKLSKATDIPMSVKVKVWHRDNERCIYCGRNNAMPSCHYIRRTAGGLGIEQNVVTLCQDCHHNFDNGDRTIREHYKEYIRNYLKSRYEDWKEEDLVFRR